MKIIFKPFLAKKRIASLRRVPSPRTSCIGTFCASVRLALFQIKIKSMYKGDNNYNFWGGTDDLLIDIGLHQGSLCPFFFTMVMNELTLSLIHI